MKAEHILVEIRRKPLEIELKRAGEKKIILCERPEQFRRVIKKAQLKLTSESHKCHNSKVRKASQSYDKIRATLKNICLTLVLPQYSNFLKIGFKIYKHSKEFPVLSFQQSRKSRHTSDNSQKETQ
ncbi:CLUMA_CG019825, isoform A [Clunio marinus]|uniref:CLUMA_CG019825, isoform A n=1 Tax=Clunio marinus TaxID=568069 RepID=A0A1J1J252_9DIPT|nr:CLUMA_CG019825, isoform A [Clunio marinus]